MIMDIKSRIIIEINYNYTRKEEGHKRSTNGRYSFTTRNDQVKIDVLR